MPQCRFLTKPAQKSHSNGSCEVLTALNRSEPENWKRKTEKKFLMEANSKSPIIGRWNITEMETWAPESFNMEVQAFIEFGPDSKGRFQFCLLQGFMDYCLMERDGKPSVEWSWEGFR